MFDRVMGLETEYAVTAVGNGDVQRARAAACIALMLAVRSRLPHLPGPSRLDYFLTNAGRAYLDSGYHPEFATPEVDDPGDAIRFKLAGEAIFRDIVVELREQDGPTRGMRLFKTNVDYASPGVTWGEHQSISYRADPSSLPDQLIPHLVTRCWTGAGGINPLNPGIEFTLSPRLQMFSAELAECMMTRGVVLAHERGIYNPREEPLAGGGYQRLHVIAGDSVNSHVACWLRLASTCLVVAMVEAGLEPARGVELEHPAAALHAYLRDPYFRTTAPVVGGNRVTALQVQRHYLEQATAHVDHPCMPSWAPLACDRWRAMLDRLEQGPDSVRLALDWAWKRPLFLQHLRRRGIDVKTLPHWNEVLALLRDARGGQVPGDREPFRAFLKSVPGRQEMKRLGPYLRDGGLDWDQVWPLLAARDELCEIDMQFGQVAPDGLFPALEPQLDHHLPEIDRIDEARTIPPPNTRARLRGQQVKKHSGKSGYRVDWEYVLNGQGMLLDLSDPYAREATWRAAGPDSPPGGGVAAILDSAYGQYERGDFERAYRILRLGTRLRGDRQAHRQYQYVRYLAWLQSRRGRIRYALRALDDYRARRGRCSSVIRDYVVVYRFQGLAPLNPGVSAWISRGDRQALRGWDSPTTCDFLANKGYVLARTGCLEQAAVVLQSACEINRLDESHSRQRARALADRADVLRILGERDEAARLLDAAQRIHARHHFPGERADHVLTNLAKLERDTNLARALLSKARVIQKRLSNRIGLVRTLLLDARLAPAKSTVTRRRNEILRLREQVPDLRTCPRLQEILARWDEWANGQRTVHGDFFWLL